MVQLMDVIVIGCGASGLAALKKLHEAGLKAIGLEAADRIGGRIRTVPFADNVVDVGAAWCHGENSNTVFELANPLNLLDRPNPDENLYVLSNGSLAYNDEVETLLQLVGDSVNEAPKDGTKSISECVRDATEGNDILKKSDLTQSVIEWYGRANHLGGQDNPQKGKSLRHLSENWICEGEQMLNWKGKGFKTILDVLMNKHPDPSKELPLEIFLNKEVESIRWSTKKVELDHSNPLVQVSCKDGSLYAAKSVIVTVSIGVLKERHTELFNPPLPVEKITAIENLEMCVLGKIYVEFTEPWWTKSPAHFGVLWQEKDKATYKQKWIPEIYSVNTVEHQPNLLLLWLYGNGAELMENDSQAEVEEGVWKFLDLFRKNFDVTPVKSVIRSQWASNPLIRGAYSYRSVATEVNCGSAVILSEPLYHHDVVPVVCFAGEGTSHHRYGAVHGAIEAGFREADRLIETLKK